MTDRSRIYYYAITGGCGGLTGWFIAAQVSIVGNTTTQTFASQLLYGAILGAIIGVAVAAYDGIMNRSVRRFIKYGSIGLVLGAFAGGLALPLAQWSYASLLSGGGEGSWQRIVVGTFCWLLFGGLIGFGEGISKGTQTWKGFLGGLIGGLTGGLLYEINRAITGSAREPFRYQFFLAVSLLLLGAAISASIALVAEVLKRAWVEILGGKFTGRSYDVTKYVDARLGSSGVVGSDQWSAHIFLPGDHDILPRHAVISFANGAPTLTVTPEASKRAVTFINGRRLSASTPLSNGDELQFGSTRVVYRQKRL